MVDYKGQSRAETLLVVCFVVICTPAWIYGYLQQDFTHPFQAWVAATVLSALVGRRRLPRGCSIDEVC
jgi:hypothetical protein